MLVSKFELGGSEYAVVSTVDVVPEIFSPRFFSAQIRDLDTSYGASTPMVPDEHGVYPFEVGYVRLGDSGDLEVFRASASGKSIVCRDWSSFIEFKKTYGGFIRPASDRGLLSDLGLVYYSSIKVTLDGVDTYVYLCGAKTGLCLPFNADFAVYDSELDCVAVAGVRASLFFPFRVKKGDIRNACVAATGYRECNGVLVLASTNPKTQLMLLKGIDGVKNSKLAQFCNSWRAGLDDLWSTSLSKLVTKLEGQQVYSDVSSLIDAASVETQLADQVSYSVAHPVLDDEPIIGEQSFLLPGAGVGTLFCDLKIQEAISFSNRLVQICKEESIDGLLKELRDANITRLHRWLASNTQPISIGSETYQFDNLRRLNSVELEFVYQDYLTRFEGSDFSLLLARAFLELNEPDPVDKYFCGLFPLEKLAERYIMSRDRVTAAKIQDVKNVLSGALGVAELKDGSSAGYAAKAHPGTLDANRNGYFHADHLWKEYDTLPEPSEEVWQLLVDVNSGKKKLSEVASLDGTLGKLLLRKTPFFFGITRNGGKFEYIRDNSRITEDSFFICHGVIPRFSNNLITGQATLRHLVYAYLFANEPEMTGVNLTLEANRAVLSFSTSLALCKYIHEAQPLDLDRPEDCLPNGKTEFLQGTVQRVQDALSTLGEISAYPPVVRRASVRSDCLVTFQNAPYPSLTSARAWFDCKSGGAYVSMEGAGTIDFTLAVNRAELVDQEFEMPAVPPELANLRIQVTAQIAEELSARLNGLASDYDVKKNDALICVTSESCAPPAVYGCISPNCSLFMEDVYDSSIDAALELVSKGPGKDLLELIVNGNRQALQPGDASVMKNCVVSPSRFNTLTGAEMARQTVRSAVGADVISAATVLESFWGSI